jgi:hypothetical protein
MSNSVELVSTGQVLVQETTEQVIELIAPTTPVTVEVVTEGPQGGFDVGGGTTLAGLSDVDVNSSVNKSVLYYDLGANKWVGDELNTLVTLTDGGNF